MSEVHVEIPETVQIPSKQFKIMIFLMNALEKGWTLKKKDAEYIFTKKHEGKREIFKENYLETFIQSNFDMDILQKTPD